MHVRFGERAWETDGEDVDLPGSVEVPALEEHEVSDWLSDKYGWLVAGWSERVVLRSDTEEALTARLGENWQDVQTGIYIRAKNTADRWDSLDIAWLDRVSLLAFLRSRDGDNPWAEDVCGILLGHGHLHEHKAEEGT